MTQVTNPDGSTAALAYDAYGNRTARTNELGKTWTSAFDEFKRLMSATDPLNRTTIYNYAVDPSGGTGGCASCQSSDHPGSITLPSGKRTSFTYDLAWRRTSKTVGDGTAAAATVNYDYDAAGNLKTTINARGKPWTLTYDNRNRLVKTTDPLGHVTAWTYDAAGNILTEKCADNGVTAYEYDAMNRRTKMTDPLNQMALMGYDAAGNMTTLTDARNNTYGFAYDLRNSKTHLTYPGTGGADHEDWTYDEAGNVKTYTTRAGQVRTSTRDSRNRETLADWSDATPDVTSTYDAAGRRLTFDNANSALSYAYDDANQLLSETQNITGWAGGAKTVSYSYDLDGNRATLTYPNALALTYAYTARNQLESVTANNPPPLATYAYDLAGNRTAKTWENGTSAAYVYDDANRLTSLAHRNGGGVFASFAYAYNAVDDRTSVTREDGLGDAYTYDATDQLTGVQYDAQNPASAAPANARKTQSFVYEAMGNRTSASENGVATAYMPNALNQYAQAGASALTYDANGNARTGFNGPDPWVYDAQNRAMTGYPIPTQGVPPSPFNAIYDARNRPVWRGVIGNQGGTYLLYDDWNLIAEYSATTSATDYVHGAQIDEILAKIDPSGAAIYYHHDGLGNTAALTDVSGASVEHYRYDVFGQPTIYNSYVPNGSSGRDTAYNNRFLFTGREWIAGWDAYDYRNRAYAPSLGRWLSRDPIRQKGGINLYAYTCNNPVNFVDLFGLSPGGWMDGGASGPEIKKICWKTMLLTYYNNDTGDRENTLGPGDVATGDARYTNDDFDARNHIKPGHVKSGPPQRAYPRGTPFTIYPGPNSTQPGNVADTGSGFAAHRRAPLNLPYGVKANEWLDVWSPTGAEEPRWAWVSMQVGECDKCPPGWIGD